MKKDNELNIAINYREQIQEKHHSEIRLDKQLLMDGCEHLRKVFPGSFDEKTLPLEILHEFFMDKGVDVKLTLNEIKKLIVLEIEDPTHPLRRLFCDTQTSFDTFLSNEVSKDYMKEIEAACLELNYDLRSGISAGLTNKSEIQAEQQLVFQTDCSIINVTENLSQLTHRLAKLLALSITFEFVSDDKYQLSQKIDDYKKHLLSNRNLQKQWDLFFADYAYSTASPSIGEVVILEGIHIQNCFTDMKDAMMIFIMGHECGHHICQHSSNGQAGSDVKDHEEQFKMEHHADIIASRIIMHIGRKPDNFNLFASTNVGAFCILTVLDLIVKGHKILDNEDSNFEFQSNSTHPPTTDRLGVLRAYIEHNEYDENSAALSLSLIDLFSELLEFIWFNASTNLKRLHMDDYRPHNNNTAQWLP